ncbi:ATP-dependent zinc metalloprotease FtsH [Burkholderia ubonensis]|uniref:ATP-dependent zinc metalloprotease FtsH n=1 Tax=Burkholderia ubonensis TaxID=101571 RepID=UPI000F58F0A1|nr:ATP-dependent zinc metalloprotease FtsH [Burkholderia ubonensis]RQP27726.1 ATP-dependent metallopeptidase FtsH/Yme1/Tma family protein [Burkholderia ubonensis]RQP29742.1 ATP-dependent metallopeptidase FtsH/Yme1/Tma family protein [Burkholderia ubonensis]RQP31898.1 ATP-dependent metallopeptidase FtsH/Yme1/Tma family protein [Burkholderia ubonensis]RQP47841.1 ATP-dependent metallopeptidase FtsH/Yme1/Tma family protein [Burkholderia ubonensis]RQP50858.1 ATP-dependent metallopeptidase FtsH/Yme1
MEFKREHQVNSLYILTALIGVLLVQILLSRPEHIKTIPYSEFQQLASQGKVTDLVVGQTRITGTYKVAGKGAPQHFSTLRVDTALAQSLSQQNVTFSGEPEPGIWPTILGWIMPMLGFALVWMFLIRPMAMGRGGEGMMSIGKSKARVYVEKDIKVTFADVAGVDEAKEELKEVVSFLRDPKSYGRLGARVPKGVLLVGPPGTGKTLLARAVAGEAGVAFFSISGSEFVEMFVGVGAARVRDLFEQARKQAPTIVFIDELDSLGRARGSALSGGGFDEKEQTLNQLLAELDGFDTSIGVVLLAATNRPEILDPALLRAGRFDRQILVDRPDKKGRCDILGVHLKKVKLATDVPIGDIAALTPGFSGADLANLVNEAAILATRRHADSVSLDDFTQAIERIVAGLEKRNRLLNPHEREIVAHHEMGHALVAMALPGVDPVQKISIIPRGIAALGYTIQRPTEDRFLMDRAELMNRMAVLLGGRAAERLVFDEISTGAADDLAKASEIARSMVVRYGMDPKLGQVAYEPEPTSTFGIPTGAEWRPRQYAEQTAAAIDAAVRELIDDAFERASSMLRANRVLLERAARDLLAKETLAGEDLDVLSRQVVSATENAGRETETETAAAPSGAIADA